MALHSPLHKQEIFLYFLAHINSPCNFFSCGRHSVSPTNSLSFDSILKKYSLRPFFYEWYRDYYKEDWPGILFLMKFLVKTLVSRSFMIVVVIPSFYSARTLECDWSVETCNISILFLIQFMRKDERHEDQFSCNSDLRFLVRCLLVLIISIFSLLSTKLNTLIIRAEDIFSPTFHHLFQFENSLSYKQDSNKKKAVKDMKKERLMTSIDFPLFVIFYALLSFPLNQWYSRLLMFGVRIMKKKKQKKKTEDTNKCHYYFMTVMTVLLLKFYWWPWGQRKIIIFY